MARHSESPVADLNDVLQHTLQNVDSPEMLLKDLALLLASQGVDVYNLHHHLDMCAEARSIDKEFVGPEKLSREQFEAIKAIVKDGVADHYANGGSEFINHTTSQTCFEKIK